MVRIILVLIVISFGTSNAGADLSILPTIKSHMARLDELMNKLFRNVDDSTHTEQLVGVVSEMQDLLQNSKKFEPISIQTKYEIKQYTSAVESYKSCLDTAIEKLTALKEALNEQRLNIAKERLLDLDLVRRKCHSRFG